MNAPVGHRVQTRWRDIDGLGHVNHAVVLSYLEEGRDRFLAPHGITREEYVVGRCSIDFKAEIDSRSRAVIVQCDVREVGRSSMTTSERIIDDCGEVLVEAEFAVVLWDRETRRSKPMPAPVKASLTAALESAVTT